MTSAESLAEHTRYRQKIVKEIVSTEQYYVNSLKAIVQVGSTLLLHLTIRGVL